MGVVFRIVKLRLAVLSREVFKDVSLFEFQFEIEIFLLLCILNTLAISYSDVGNTSSRVEEGLAFRLPVATINVVFIITMIS